MSDFSDSDSDVSSEEENVNGVDEEQQLTTEENLPETEIANDAQILKSYRALTARRVDLVGDYSGKELFLIDGDSLLLQCFSDKHLDFEDGFQMLHASYLVERTLENLSRRKCVFHVVFFEAHRQLCIPSSSASSNSSRYYLARAAIILHLQNRLPAVSPSMKLLSFKSMDDAAFGNYLTETRPYFAMCHDGALAGQKSAKKASKAVTTHKVKSRTIIMSFITRGYNVALINELNFRDTKAITAVLEGSPKQMNMRLPDLTADVDVPDQSWVGEAAKEAQSSTDFASLDVRDRAVLLTLAHLLEDKKWSESGHLFKAFLTHVALLKHLPLSSRRLDSTSHTEKLSEFLSDFTISAEKVVRHLSESSSALDAEDFGIVDLIDGRLLFFVADHDLSPDTAEIQASFKKLLASLGDLVSGSASALASTTKKSASTNGHSPLTAGEEEEETLSVLPFTNPVFDKHLQSARLAIDEVSEPYLTTSSARVFREVTHWHSAKKPLVRKGPTSVPQTSARDAAWVLRLNQWFLAEMQKYAASLTNSVGISLEPETIVVSTQGPSISNTSKQAKIAASGETKEKPAKGGAKSNNSKKQMIQAEIAAAQSKRDDQVNEKSLHAWHVYCKILNAENDLANRHRLLSVYYNTLPSSKREVVGPEVQLYMLSTLLERYVELKRPKPLGLAALIWHTARELAQRTVTQTIKDAVDLTVKALKLPNVPGLQSTGQARALPFRFSLLKANLADLALDLSSLDFQLLHGGPYLDRSIDSAPDSRVDFEPDGWQRKVLDGIDADKSLFVVAPTSAGKTFISFYAMKKVLETDDEGVVVYIAPTKALVNQIAAEIQARFSKKFKHAGKSVWAIHTRDYRINNPTKCQVLVTVPHILQIMLLSPSNVAWSGRIKRIIFDEIHSISNAEDGVVWEQLLLLSPCPIIALSATVGNPDDFGGWLSSTQTSIGKELETVVHSTRYSDLRKFSYTPPKTFTFSGLGHRAEFGKLGLDDTVGFIYVHPVASLIDKARGMPDDLQLEARDALLLCQSMKKHQTAAFPFPAALDPKKLPSNVRKIDILQWESSLKDLIRAWMASNDSPFDAVRQELGESFYSAKREENQRTKETAVPSEKTYKVNCDDILQTTLPMLARLHEQDALPAILFNYDRGGCEDICRTLCEELQKTEASWKASSTKWQSTIKAFEEWKLVKEKANARKGKDTSKAKSKSKKGDPEDREDIGSKTDQQRDSAGRETSKFEGFNPDAPIDGYHFADHKMLAQSELDVYIRQLVRKRIPQDLINAIGRGIGVHHAGMNRKYRQIVEILFRKRFLRVIVATGTLALGINMPCKTVVFSGDSVFLTALNYRQAAGRAGRRGFDLLGNVVFQNITNSKICRLLSSRLPDLNGHFPVTTTLVLRLFTLLHDTKNSQYACTAINTLLSQPRLFIGGSEFKDQTMHHLRFSIEYLRRQHLLSSTGAPLNFAGLVSHLYFTENSSFAFHALLKEGYFHSLCAGIAGSEVQTLEDLMLVMAHLFGRQYCRRSDEEYRQTVAKPSSSIVFLPSLPEQALQILQTHDKQTLQVFRTYVRTFVDQHVSAPDNKLPLTGLEVGGKGDTTLFEEAATPTHVRSQFVALSGHSDHFTSISDLCQTTRSGVFLEESAIPHVSLYPQDDDQAPLNAYLLDFYKHGDVKTLERANKIRRNDVWFFLNDFSLVLATIIASLSNFMKISPMDDLEMLDLMGGGDSIEEAEDGQIAATDTDTASTTDSAIGMMETIQQTAAKKPAAATKGKKAKDVDSWETLADDDEEKIAKEEKANGRSVGEEKLDKKMEELDLGSTAWDGPGGEQGLKNVLKAFQLLSKEFNTKFKAMWA